MLDLEGIAGKGLLRRESVVELLKFEREKDNLFADFPIGTTIQDGGKRKRSDVCPSYPHHSTYADILRKITDSFNLELLLPIVQVST